MFTGIVEELGRVIAIDPDRLTLSGHVVLEDAATGDSIAVNGACLTLIEQGDGWWVADVSEETWSRTNLRDLGVDDPVNLERPVRVEDRLGGHVVQGHVDAVGAGEFVSLLGPSGCGKSTLLRIIGGLQRPTRGVVQVAGGSAEAARRRKQYGLVPQSPALVPWKTVADNVRFLSGLHRHRRRRGTRRTPTRSPACSMPSASPGSRRRTRTSCPAGCSSASRWSGRSPSARRSC